MAVIDSYPESNASSYWNVYIGSTGTGQTFTGNGANVGAVRLYLTAAGAISLQVKIFAHTGTYGTSGGLPTGSALATSDTVALGAVGSPTLVEFPFTGDQQIALANGTHYGLVVYAVAGGGAYSSNIYTDNSEPTHGGTWIRDYDGTFVGSDNCLIFYVDEAEAAFDPPVVDAGDDQTVVGPNPTTVSMDGSVTSDAPVVDALWTKVSGPTGFAFDDDTDPASDVTFTASGTYVFRLTADDGVNSPVSDDVTFVMTLALWKQVMFLEDFASLSVFADNGAAETGGVLVGRPYRTSSGVVMVRY